ncbi:MAG: 16S rRNA processing protein RimM [Acidobacteriota bacterium]|nr:16S rRNA processing protein RimM [Acidobacteriota bacterium]
MTETVHGLPPLMRAGLRVAAVPPSLRKDRWHEVVSVGDGGGTGQLVSLSGVSGRGDAESLVGKTLLAAVGDLPADYPLHDADALLGREVEDAAFGPLGRIEEVMTGPAHDVWVVRGACGEALIPVVPEIVRDLGSAGAILVRVPEGTVDAHKEGGRPCASTSSP